MYSTQKNQPSDVSNVEWSVDPPLQFHNVRGAQVVNDQHYNHE